jgi:hypothetical protein
MQQVLEQYIESQLSKYLVPAEARRVQIGVLSGDVKLQNVQLKRELLLEIMGLEIEVGRIESLEIGLPWQDLLRGKLRVELKGLKLKLVQKERKERKEVWKSKRELVDGKKVKKIIENMMMTMTTNIMQRMVRNMKIIVEGVEIELTTIEGSKMNMKCDKISVKSAIEEEAGEKLKLLDKILEIKNFTLAFCQQQVLAPVCLMIRVRHSFQTNKLEASIESAIEGGVRLDDEQFKQFNGFLQNLVALARQATTVERLRMDDLREDIFSATQAMGVFEEFIELYTKIQTKMEICEDERNRYHELFARLPIDVIAKWESDVDKVVAPTGIVSTTSGGNATSSSGLMGKLGSLSVVSKVKSWFSRGPTEKEMMERLTKEIDFEKVKEKLKSVMDEAASNVEEHNPLAIAGLTVNVKLGALNVVLVREGVNMLQANLAGLDLEAAIARTPEVDSAQVDIRTRSISVHFFGERIISLLDDLGSGFAQTVKILVTNAVATNKKSVKVEFKALPLLIHVPAGLPNENDAESFDGVDDDQLSDEEKQLKTEAIENRRKKLEAIASQLRSELASVAVSIDLAGPIIRLPLKNGNVVEVTSGRLLVDTPELTEAIDLKFMKTGVRIGSLDVLAPNSVLSCAVRPQAKRIDLTMSDEMKIFVDNRTVDVAMEIVQFVQSEIESIFPPAPLGSQQPEADEPRITSDIDNVAVADAVAKAVGGWELSLHDAQTAVTLRQTLAAEGLVFRAALSGLKLREVSGTWDGRIGSIKTSALTEKSLEPVLEHTEFSLNFTLSSRGMTAKLQANETVAVNFWPELLDLFLGSTSDATIRNIANICSRTPVEILPSDQDQPLMLEPSQHLVDQVGQVPERFYVRNPFSLSQTELVEFGKIGQGVSQFIYTSDWELGFRVERKVGTSSLTVAPLLRIVNYTPFTTVVQLHGGRLELELKAFTAEDLFESFGVNDAEELVELSLEFSSAATDRKRFELPLRSMKQKTLRLDLSPSASIVTAMPVDVTLDQGMLSFSVAKVLRDESGLNLQLVADDTPLAMVDTDVFRWTSETITRKSWLHGARISAHFPEGDRLWMLPEDVRSVRLYEGKEYTRLNLPLQGFWSEISSPCEGHKLICRSEVQDVGSVSVTMFRLIAKYRVTNELPREISVTLASGGVLFLKAHECAAVPSAPVSVATGRDVAGCVPTSLRVQDEFAGSWAVSLEETVARLDIAPRDGVTHVTFRDKAKYMVKNLIRKGG